MKTLSLFVVFLGVSFAQQWTGTARVTNTQAVLEFRGVTAPSTCGIQVAEDAAFTKIINDTNTTLYPGSDLLNRAGNIVDGQYVQFVVGKRSNPVASDGLSYSGALKLATHYWFRGTGTCSGVTAMSGQFDTGTIPLGNTHGEGNPTRSPGVYDHPTVDFTDAGKSKALVDSQTGLPYFRVSAVGGGAPTTVSFGAATGSGWTNPGNAIVDDSSYATISASQNVLDVAWDDTGHDLGGYKYTGNTFDSFKVSVKGKASATQNIQVCLKLGGACVSPWVTGTLTTTEATINFGTNNAGDTLGMATPLNRANAAARYGNVLYNATTKQFTLSGKNSTTHNSADPFDMGWAAGTNLVVANTPITIDDISTGSNPTVTTTNAHGYSTGDQVSIAMSAVDSLVGATGIWTITVTGTKTFTLNGATTTGSLGSAFNDSVSSGTAGSPPVVYIPNSNWPSGVRVKGQGCTDSGWTSLNYATNGNVIFTANQSGDSEHFSIVGATTTGAFTQVSGCRLRRLTATSSKVGAYPISSVDSPGQITVSTGPAADIVADGNGFGVDYEYHPFSVGIRMADTAANTVSINSVTASYSISGSIGWPAAGSGFTHPTPYNGYYYGRIGTSTLWAFKTDGSEAHPVGYIQQGLNYAAGDNCAGGQANVNDPNQWYCDTNIAGAINGINERKIAKGVLFNDGTPLPNNPDNTIVGDCTGTPIAPCWSSWTNLFPTGYIHLILADSPIIATRLAAYANGAVGSYYCGSSGTIWSTQTNSVHAGITCGVGGNGIGVYYCIIDLGNEIPYGTAGSTIHVIGCRDTWSGREARFSGSHGGGMRGWPEKGFVTWAAHAPPAGGSDTGDYKGPYSITIDTPFMIADGQSCASFVAAGKTLLPGIPVPFPSDMKCVTKHVDYEPCDDSLGSNELIQYNANPTFHNTKCGRTNAFWLQDAIPGDVFTFCTASTNACHEIVMLIDKGSDGHTWTFTQGHFWGYYADNAYVPGPYDHPGQTTLYIHTNIENYNNNLKSYAIAWDYMADPHPDATHDAVIHVNNWTDGHGFDGFFAESHYNSSSYACGPTCEGVKLGKLEDRWQQYEYNATATQAPKWSGIVTHGYPNQTDTHATMAQSAAHADRNWYLDGRPWNGPDNIGTADQIVGQRYRYRYANTTCAFGGGNGTCAYMPKHFDLLAYAGDFPIKDVSGPGVQLGTGAADSFKSCAPVVAGECDPASQPGDLYINAPNVSGSGAGDQICCGASPVGRNDLGWGNAWPAAQNIAQTMIVNDPWGKYQRNLGRFQIRYRIFDTFYNTSMTGDGLTGIMRIRGMGGLRDAIVSYKLPTYALDSVNRGSWIPINVPYSRTTGTRSRVKFGYDTSFHCAGRNDPCYAIAASINESNPYLFGVELSSTSGLAASSGSIPVPAISGRVLYYQVEHIDSGGTVVATGPVRVTVVQ